MPSSKYSTYDAQKPPAPKIHPVWRGLGFVMIVLAPIMSWAGAEVTNQILRGIDDKYVKSFFYGLSGSLPVPGWLNFIPLVANAWRAVATYEDIKSKLVLFFLWLVAFSGVLSVLYAMMYRLIGPPRYGPQDIPAPRVRSKRYTR